MRLPRLRFTVRRLMVIVAVVALILGAEATRRRWVYFRQKALENGLAEEFDRFLLGGGMATVQWEDGRVEQIIGPMPIRVDEKGGFIEVYPMPGYDAESLRRRADYHAYLKKKYQNAADRPWLTVVPDPPKPE